MIDAVNKSDAGGGVNPRYGLARKIPPGLESGPDWLMAGIVRPLILLFPLSMLLAGCAVFNFGADTNPPARSSEPRYLGEVATVNPEAKFLLIDISGFQAPAAGTELVARRKGEETARLRAGDEVRRPFAVADILSGNPETGDGVWLAKKTL